MKTKNLIILIVVAAVLVALAYLSSTRKTRTDVAASAVGQHVLPALQEGDTLGRVEKIVVRSRSATSMVARVNEAWVAPNKYGYPAKFDKIHDLVRKLADLKVGQTVPGDASQAKALQLISPETASTNDAANAGTLVQLLDKADAVVASLVVGKEHMRKPSGDSPFGGYGGYPDGRYISAAGKAALVAESFSDLPSADKDWLDADIVNVMSSDITDMVVTNAAGKRIELRRADPNASFTIAPLAADEELDSSKVSSLSGVLNYLTFTDVANPSLSDTNTGMGAATVCVMKTKQGKVYTLKVGKTLPGSSDRYLRLSAAFVPPPEPPSTNVLDQAKEAGKKPEEIEQEKKKIEEEAKKKKAEQETFANEARDLNDKVSRWTYVVASYKLDSVTANREDIVKKKEKPKEEPKPAATAESRTNAPGPSPGAQAK
jgi:hypothetical protein